MNFTFLNPFFLIGLAAVLLPIVAHLISRKSGVKKSFSAVTFLLASSGDTARRSRIKDLLLLLLRSLILVLLVLVFAKPALFSFSSMDSNEARSVAIVVDNSFSMGYGDHFDTAKRRAEEVIDSLTDGSFGVVLPLVQGGPSVKPEVTSDRGKMKEDLKDIRLSYSFTDNERRIEEIYGLIKRAPNQRKEVILITDAQKNGWNEENPQREWLIPVDVTAGKDIWNRAISGIEFEEEEKSIRVRVAVSNFSARPVSDLLTTVSLNDQEINSHFQIEPEDQEMREFIFPRDRLSSGELSGHARLEPDKLTVDDHRHLVLSQRTGFQVLIVDGDPREDARLSETYYLARAIETISEIISLDLETKDNDSFLGAELEKYDLVFLANVGDITPQKSKELENFLEEGGALVLFLGDRIKSTVYNSLLRFLPAELEGLSAGEYSLKTLSSDGSFGAADDLYGRVGVKRAFELRAGEQAEVLLSLSNNLPFLIKEERGKGTVFLFASTADADWNSFPLTPVFLPTVKEVFELSQRTKSRRRSFLVGEAFEVEFSGRSMQKTVKTPGGERIEVAREVPMFSYTFLPGIYSIEEGGEVIDSFSVNLDPRESNITRIPLEAVPPKSRAKSGSVRVFKEIWSYFLWGVISLFIAESLFRILYSR